MSRENNSIDIQHVIDELYTAVGACLYDGRVIVEESSSDDESSSDEQPAIPRSICQNHDVLLIHIATLVNKWSDDCLNINNTSMRGKVDLLIMLEERYLLLSVPGNRLATLRANLHDVINTWMHHFPCNKNTRMYEKAVELRTIMAMTIAGVSCYNNNSVTFRDVNLLYAKYGRGHLDLIQTKVRDLVYEWVGYKPYDNQKEPYTQLLMYVILSMKRNILSYD